VTELDRLVALAQEDAERNVVVMAEAVGAHLNADVLRLDPANVRLLVKIAKAGVRKQRCPESRPCALGEPAQRRGGNH